MLTQVFLVYSPYQWWVCHFWGDKFSVFGILNLNNDVLSHYGIGDYAMFMFSVSGWNEQTKFCTVSIWHLLISIQNYTVHSRWWKETKIGESFCWLVLCRIPLSTHLILHLHLELYKPLKFIKKYAGGPGGGAWGDERHGYPPPMYNNFVKYLKHFFVNKIFKNTF